jgi:hypothetical protein
MDPDARAVRLWRLQLQTACHHYLQGIAGKNITDDDLHQKAMMEAEALSRIKVPDPPTIIRSPNSQELLLSYPACDHIFLDLGTNRGDSIRCAVDASLDVCSSIFVGHDPSITRAYRISKDFPRPHFNLSDLKVHGKGSQALSLLRLLQKFFEGPGMESVCVYGMEGNRYFNERLHALEDVINHMHPRPLKFLRIHTETIVTSKDGQSSLFLDQHSEKNHVSWRPTIVRLLAWFLLYIRRTHPSVLDFWQFWGSSILQSMPEIRQTSKQNNGTSVEAIVQGITLSTLLRKTLEPTQGRSGGSLLIKMDVEGAEFGVLKEVATSNVLCDYTLSGNNTTLIVEFHQHLIQDPDVKRDALAGLRDAKDKLRKCGIKLRNLPDFWT